MLCTILKAIVLIIETSNEGFKLKNIKNMIDEVEAVQSRIDSIGCLLNTIRSEGGFHIESRNRGAKIYFDSIDDRNAVTDLLVNICNTIANENKSKLDTLNTLSDLVGETK